MIKFQLILICFLVSQGALGLNPIEDSIISTEFQNEDYSPLNSIDQFSVNTSMEIGELKVLNHDYFFNQVEAEDPELWNQENSIPIQSISKL